MIPPIPHEIDDVVFEGEWTQTWKGKQFLKHQDNNWGILIFATEKDLKKLQKCHIIILTGLLKLVQGHITNF